MSLNLTAYRVAKASLARLPASLLRVRPYRVYAARIEPEGPGVAESPALSGGADRPESMRLVRSPAEASDLAHLATAENLRRCDGRARWGAAAYQDGRAIACAWIAEDDYEEPELGIRYELGPDDAWLYAAVVEPSRRRTGVYGHLLCFVCEELWARRKRRLLFGVTMGNNASRRAHRALGPTLLGSVVAARSFGRSISYTSGELASTSRSPISAGHKITLRPPAMPGPDA